MRRHWGVAIAPGKFFDNGGSITVAPVPEPSAAALALVACLGAAGVISIAGIGACEG